MSFCPHTFDKYCVESLLSKVLHNLLSTTCSSQEHDRDEKDGFLGFCDKGESKTPILLDHNQLVPVVVPSSGNTARNIMRLPCHFHTLPVSHRFSNLRISRNRPFPPLIMSARIHPMKLVRMTTPPPRAVANFPYMPFRQVACSCSHTFLRRRDFSTAYVDGGDGLPVYLDVLSLSPRVFDVFNFFSNDESADLVTRAHWRKRPNRIASNEAPSPVRLGIKSIGDALPKVDSTQPARLL
jgi:hypothetical protein